MPWFEKKFNKVLIGLVIGTTIAWVAGARTPAGKKVVKKTTSGLLSWAKKIIWFLQSGLEEMSKKIEEKEGNEDDSSDIQKIE